MTLTDDYSRATTVHCIERKSDVFDKFKQYVAITETLHGHKVAKLKVDNGSEYSSNEFKSYCCEKGIQIMYTVPYNPEMNSVAELNRTLQEKALTPAEIWFGSKPDLSHMKIFGSICYNYVPAENRKKFEQKSTKCVFLGYASSHGAYRLWNLENNNDEKSILNKNNMVIQRWNTKKLR